MDNSNPWWIVGNSSGCSQPLSSSKKEKMSKEAILGVVRHVLTFMGGFAAERGIASGEEVQTGVGAVITLIGLVWSVLNKRGK
jgi:hypothetical protein